MPSFWEHSDLWLNQMIAGIVAGGLCGFLGIWVVLRRVVFVSAAMGEIAGLGVVMAFFLAVRLLPAEQLPHAHGQAAATVRAETTAAAASTPPERMESPTVAADGVVSDDELAALLGDIGVGDPGLAVGSATSAGGDDRHDGGASSGVFGARGGVEPYVPPPGARERDSAHEHGLSRIPLWLQPMLVAIVFVVVAAIMLSVAPRYKRITQESVIGLAYLLAAGLVVLIGSRIPQGTHEIRHVLEGDSVSLDSAQLYGLLAAAGVVVVLQKLFFKEFLFVSFDPETAGASGIPTRPMSVLILVSIGIVIAAAARAVGALPVFAFLVLPPVAALLAVSSLRMAFVVSAGLGALAAALGYYLAWIWQFPAGACRVVTAAALVLPAVVIWRLRKN
ncbi:MAG: metal ABC transporter permease [Myxococcota bacterium]|nr:metal ABC transporter permease [Myxococcota bacterium]